MLERGFNVAWLVSLIRATLQKGNYLFDEASGAEGLRSTMYIARLEHGPASAWAGCSSLPPHPLWWW